MLFDDCLPCYLTIVYHVFSDIFHKNTEMLTMPMFPIQNIWILTVAITVFLNREFDTYYRPRASAKADTAKAEKERGMKTVDHSKRKTREWIAMCTNPHAFILKIYITTLSSIVKNILNNFKTHGQTSSQNT
jgi:hypothetical protein